MHMDVDWAGRTVLPAALADALAGERWAVDYTIGEGGEVTITARKTGESPQPVAVPEPAHSADHPEQDVIACLLADLTPTLLPARRASTSVLVTRQFKEALRGLPDSDRSAVVAVMFALSQNVAHPSVHVDGTPQVCVLAVPAGDVRAEYRREVDPNRPVTWVRILPGTRSA